MKKAAFIFDLDNTIYPVNSIGDKLFGDLFKTIAKDGRYQGDMKQIKKRDYAQTWFSCSRTGYLGFRR